MGAVRCRDRYARKRLYLSESVDGFAPPAPFTLSELDFEGVLPERLYSKDELRVYLTHGRNKCRTTIDRLTAQRAAERRSFGWMEGTVTERQCTDSAPGWVARTKHGRGDHICGSLLPSPIIC